MSPRAVTRLPSRQVHPDCHPSPHLPDLAAGFDAAACAGMFAQARVNTTARQVSDFSPGAPLERAPVGTFQLPAARGRLLPKVPVFLAP